MKRAVLALVSLWVAAPALAQAVPELDELRDAILESRERVGQHERKERAILERLDQSNRLLAALGREVRGATADANRAQEQATHFERRSRLARRRLEATREAMSRRVVALYKAGAVGPGRFLFASETMPELLRRAAALETFVEYDASLVERYREYLVAYDDLEQEAKLAMLVRKQATARLTKRSGQLSEERGERRRILSRVRKDRTSERMLLVELEKAARALEETLQALGDTGGGRPMAVSRGFAKRKGRLAAPVDSVIERAFGKVVDAEFQTETLRRGVDFAASDGESVRAVAPVFASQRHTDPFRATQRHVAPFRATQRQLAPCRSISRHLGPCRAMQDHIAPFSTISLHVVSLRAI